MSVDILKREERWRLGCPETEWDIKRKEEIIQFRILIPLLERTKN